MCRLSEVLGLDYNEEPQDQCIDADQWVDDAKLNQLSRMGIAWARIQLRHHDIYFIPRRVVHQFKTVAAGTSVTWHIKYKGYYKKEEGGVVEDSVAGGERREEHDGDVKMEE